MSEAIRVLRVIARLNMGGPAQHVGLLSGRRMERLGYRTLLVHGRLAPGEEALEEVAMREGADLRFMPELAPPLVPVDDLRALRRLAGAVRVFRPHIVHTHTAKAGFLGRAAALAARPRPKIVHTYHGHVLRGYFGEATSRAFLELERSLARVSDALIGVSRGTVDELVELGVAPRSRFRVIPLGLDLERFAALDSRPDPDARRALGIGDGEVMFMFTGRLVPIKRLDVMLEALGRARRAGAAARLVVVGDGESRTDLEARAGSLGLSDSVAFAGYRTDLLPYAAAADAALLSSDSEGTPVSLIEAAAAARPAVATAVGGVPDVVSDGTGVLVPAGDGRALGSAIERIAGDEGERVAMGLRARELAVERYAADRLVADVDGLYRELLGG